MQKKLELKEIASLGRTFEEYCDMFSLNKDILKSKTILDVASGCSSFCAQANTKGFDVTATDLIYDLSPALIKNKFDKELGEVIRQLPDIAHLYKWDLFKNKFDLNTQRQKAFDLFFKDYQHQRNKKYFVVDYPKTNFCNNQFDICLVSHMLFMYEEYLDFEFHKQTALELTRITNQEIRIFPIVNMSGKKSVFVEPLIDYLQSKQISADIVGVNYEFIKGGNQMMVIKSGK